MEIEKELQQELKNTDAEEVSGISHFLNPLSSSKLLKSTKC